MIANGLYEITENSTYIYLHSSSICCVNIQILNKIDS